MENNFEEKMEKLNTPNTDFVKHQEVLKIGMINARKSARIGIVFILIPMVLVILAYLKIKLLIHWDFFDKLQRFVSNTNQTSFSTWVSHIILIGLPILAIIINLLAITHFYVNKQNKELIITIRYHLKNLIVLLISASLLVIVFIYVLLLSQI
ncbi:MAG: hypothetical protein CVU11_04660 [Bacteroidetes bacterium HGW-Bacteroidetes-6]|jgi:uncharacterized membrane protein YidH (DUF202 family)|nr:MAG: hypothetical protein CVU11_04660 [Bacteroidetes bacterium HGW-Bacteroidetes-6]